MKKCLLSESFVHEIHIVDFDYALIFMKQFFPLGPAVVFNASNEEP